MKYCCQAFFDKASHADPDGDEPCRPLSTPLFEQTSDGTWCINGGCEGEYYIVVGMRFCPFCGANMTSPEFREDVAKRLCVDCHAQVRLMSAYSHNGVEPLCRCCWLDRQRKAKKNESPTAGL